MDGPPDALLALAPDGLQLDPRGGDVHRAEGAQVEALGLRATVGDEIDLEKPGRASVHSVKVRMGISCLRTEPGRVIVAPRGGYWARAGPSSRASVGRLACRTSLSTPGAG